jgi:prenylcysteine oxidase/farnesylcysteine lyase
MDVKGTSTAYFLNPITSSSESNLVMDIHIYEISWRVGAHCNSWQLLSRPETSPIELGTSIFVEKNYILMNLTKHFGMNERNPLECIAETGRA